MTPLDLLGVEPARLLDAPMNEQFPGLREGQRRFDGPGGTLVHAAVAESIAAYLAGPHVANDHGAFAASHFSDAVLDWATARIRALLGAPTGEVVFGANMTTLTSTFLQAIAPTLAPGDEIVCTELDHEANVAPWTALAASGGVTVRTARIAPDGTLPTDAVVELLTPRTRWVAVTAASNALGSVPDLAAITAAAHRVGARVYVDGVQAVAHLPVDLAGLGCDAFVSSVYKWYGPHLGVLWVHEAVAETLRLPGQVPSAGDDLPDRLFLGTRNFEAVLGAGVAAEVLLGWDREALVQREAKLTELLLALFADNPAVRVLGPGLGSKRVPVVTFTVAGRAATEVAQRLAGAGISVWHGTFYSTAAIRAVSPEEPDVVRAGIACYTTEDDVRMLAHEVCG